MSLSEFLFIHVDYHTVC